MPGSLFVYFLHLKSHHVLRCCHVLKDLMKFFWRVLLHCCKMPFVPSLSLSFSHISQRRCQVCFNNSLYMKHNLLFYFLLMNFQWHMKDAHSLPACLMPTSAAIFLHPEKILPSQFFQKNDLHQTRQLFCFMFRQICNRSFHLSHAIEGSLGFYSKWLWYHLIW